jgi:threonine/homoserine/homoserine lactone efflux protein
MKWPWIIVLLIVGVLAALLAAEYLSVSIHALPSWLGQHKGRGHYRKRGAGAALISLIAFAGAGYLIYRGRQADKSAVAATSPSVPAPSAAVEEPAEAAALPEQPTEQ